MHAPVLCIMVPDLIPDISQLVFLYYSSAMFKFCKFAVLVFFKYKYKDIH